MKNMTTIAVIDDDEDIVLSLKTVLESRAYNVITACDGEEGIELVVKEHPDLIILDVMMPRKNGFEVCRELKGNPEYKSCAGIPIILLTVYPGDREAANLTLQEGRTMEADDYIQKPFKPAVILDIVEQLLKKKK